MSNLIDRVDKVVINLDGNKNDTDDIGALPLMAMLVKGGGIEDKTTIFYNNNLTETSNWSQVERMRASAGFAESLSIETVDYESSNSSATEKLAKLFNSGEKVLSIEGGPMEAVYRALVLTSEEKRKNVTLS